ncbi:hypothetical protein [Streptomyces sp. NPDC126499]|uniref:hypothetical protein n=1 Tax=Streptomyces sp. NPDC126499 TaxID=3155314 RepID=UPI00332EAD8D
MTAGWTETARAETERAQTARAETARAAAATAATAAAQPVVGTGRAAGTAEAARLVERWLLRGGAQIEEGPQRGAVAGWLDRDGRPEFVYLEITGYYLTTMAWLASGAASSPERAAEAHAHGRQALDWITRGLADGGVPPTRLYLSSGRSDWRNAGVFTFDLAMAARGVTSFADTDPRAERRDAARKTAADLCALVDGICAGAALLRSHDTVGGAPLPDRWSTRPGPHHLKAAAALLRVPDGVLRTPLVRVCRRTRAHWEARLAEAWPCRELHPLLYGIEGLLLAPPEPSAEGGATEGGADPRLELVERIYTRLMGLQHGDGTLAETTAGGKVRSDVLAQALRIGLLLRRRGLLRGDDWAGRLEALAGALLGFVRPDGKVLFSGDQDIANVWCAMFAHQALLLHSRTTDPRLPSVFSELLV